MPVELVPGINQTYYMLSFDASGNERLDDPDGRMSQLIADVLRQEQISDVFIFSHGWKNDVPAARISYSAWIRAMASSELDVNAMRAARTAFNPLLVGLHWPSLPWGDEDLTSTATSFAPLEVSSGASVEMLVQQYAERLADTERARAALRTIFEAAKVDIAPFELPRHVVDAYLALAEEVGLRSAGPGGAPGDDQEPFDPERRFENAEAEAADFGGIGLSGLLAPLQQLSFWSMKARARTIGEGGGHEWLQHLLETGRSEVRFHLMGHSFGCIMVCAMLHGPGGTGSLPRPVNSMALVQGALSHWSYCSALPFQPEQAGYFHALIADEKVSGPIITTRSAHDAALRRFYPIGAGVAGQVDFAPGALPRYGALGTFGAHGPGIEPVDGTLLALDGEYEFQARRIYNLESSHIIREGQGPSGAHSDILKPEVAHAVWQAALGSGSA